MEEAEDQQRFTRLFRLHYRTVYRYIRVLVPQPHDADDVFQDTCQLLWNKFSTYEEGTNFSAWACRIAYFRSLKLREQRFRSPRLFGIEFHEVVSDAANTGAEELGSRSTALQQCQKKLNQRDRDLLERYYRPGATAKLVARHTKQSVHAVYRAMRRIHDLLYHCINQSLHEESHS